MTQEQISTLGVPQSGEDCTQSFEQLSSNRFKILMKCSGSQTGSGEGEFIIKNQKEYTGTIIMDVNMNGQMDTITMKQQGKWRSSNCGDLAD